MAFLLLAVVYILLSVLTKPSASTLSKYHIDRAEDVWLTLTIVVPYVIIWLIALRGCLGLRSYADSIKSGRDAAAISTITRGLLWLAFWLPFSTLLSTIAQLIYTKHPAATGNLIRLENYANVILLLIAFVIIYKGAKQLLLLIRPGRYKIREWLHIVTIAGSALYVWLVLQDPARHAPTKSVAVAGYYQPDWLLVITVLIPRLVGWYLGLRAVHIMYFYRRHIKGAIYKEIFKDLAHGLAVVVIATVLLRSLQSVGTQLSKLALAPLLLLVYVLLIIIAVGYLYIVHGARQLQKIEEH